MKPNKFIITLVLILITSNSLIAQRAEPVHSVIVSGKDSIWYSQQAEAWESEVKKQPKSEEAWRNLFNAKFYLKFWFNGLKEETDLSNSVLARMEKAIPETFTYNYCRYKVAMGGVSEFAERSLTMVPKDVDPETVDGLLGYLWRTGADLDKGKRGKKFNQLLKRQYENGFYPNFALRYNYNQLEGMHEDAIYIGIGDLDLFPKIMMQRAMNLHTDKLIVASPFLTLKSYRDSICSHLSIEPYPSEEESSENYSKFIQYLSEQTGRAIYLNASVANQKDHQGTEPFKTLSRCLYHEGLLLKYSPQPYNNKEAALQAIEKYHLEYLTEPQFQPENYWKGSELLQVNYVVLLANYIQEYKTSGNTKRAEWLKKILQASITNTQLDETTKQKYLKFLEIHRP